jgi:hypothetical protein
MKEGNLRRKIKDIGGIFILFTGGILIMTSCGIITLFTCRSIILASLFAILNFVVFVLQTARAGTKTNKLFLFWSLGGLFIRLFMMLILIFISIKFLKVDLVGFIFTFFIWYVFLLFVEIWIIHKGTAGHNK